MGDSSFPHLEGTCSSGCSPNTKPVCASAVLMSKSTRKGKDEKEKGKCRMGLKMALKYSPGAEIRK